ncbi:hypothetical protein KSP39_PZI015316 [Platanthera zijinensis]|uniref:Uncharacterized protein n=1 Tax=Platanthera zijinensis TaxID=2320716 RepID=A0AAP0B9V1_9ASPA
MSISIFCSAESSNYITKIENSDYIVCLHIKKICTSLYFLLWHAYFRPCANFYARTRIFHLSANFSSRCTLFDKHDFFCTTTIFFIWLRFIHLDVVFTTGANFSIAHKFLARTGIFQPDTNFSSECNFFVQVRIFRPDLIFFAQRQKKCSSEIKQARAKKSRSCKKIAVGPRAKKSALGRNKHTRAKNRARAEKFASGRKMRLGGIHARGKMRVRTKMYARAKNARPGGKTRAQSKDPRRVKNCPPGRKICVWDKNERPCEKCALRQKIRSQLNNTPIFGQ